MMMLSQRSRTSYVSVTLLAIVLALTVPATASVGNGDLETALDRYISAEDPAYSYVVVGEPVNKGLYSVVTLTLFSQRWQEFTWIHNVTMYVPLFCRESGPVTILVNGGATPSKDLQGLSAVAVATQTPLAILGRVPNQPLRPEEDANRLYVRKIHGDRGRNMASPSSDDQECCRMYGCFGFYCSQGKFKPVVRDRRGIKARMDSWLSAAVDQGDGHPLVYDNLNLAQLDNHLPLGRAQ